MKSRYSVCLGAAALLLGGLFAAPQSLKAGEAQDSEQISKLLSDVKSTAFQVKEDAVTMESFTHMDVSWQSHAVAINQIKDHVNTLGKDAARLKQLRETGSPWQKTAIDRVGPYIDELGGYTSAVIEHINREHKHTLTEYRDYLEANADYSSDLAAMIANFVDYGKTRQRLERLGDKLEVSSRSER